MTMSSEVAPAVQLDRYGIPIDHNRQRQTMMPSVGNDGQQVPRRCSMNEEEQRDRRASIKAIMNDPTLTPLERRRSIQGLMDGRRRSSCGGGGSSSTEAMLAASGPAMAGPGGEVGAVAATTTTYGQEGAPPGPGMMQRNASMGSTPYDTSAIVHRVEMETHHHHNVMPYQGGTGVRQVSGASGASAPIQATDPDVAARQAAQTAAVQLAMWTRMERNRPPCTHYQRNCTMISPCCGMAFGCRICHDECPVLPPPLLNEQNKTEQSSKMMRYQRSNSMPTSFSGLPDQEEQHQIDRFKIAEVLCRVCFTRQSSKTNNCIKCHTQFGEYHCEVCNLWMSSDENPYHCKDCGFCRVGGAENFRHCKDCGMCIDAALFDEHNCKIGKYMSNCPVCQEDLFSSRAASHEMPCGHAIHWHCFRELASYDSRCPVCKKTAETPERMASTWSAMAMGIALQPVPPDMAKVVDILCVDCEAGDEHRRWHFLGVQCRRCQSFNTVVERILMAGPEAASFLREHGDGARGSAQPDNNASGGGGGENHAHHHPGGMMARRNTGAHTTSSSINHVSTGGGLLYDPYGLDDDTSDDEEDDMEVDEPMTM